VQRFAVVDYRVVMMRVIHYDQSSEKMSNIMLNNQVTSCDDDDDDDVPSPSS
jgi:hypothetical protein